MAQSGSMLRFAGSLSRLQRRGSVLAACTCAVLWVAGCGSEQGRNSLYPVTGRVELPNGRPLTEGRVAFVSADGTASPAYGELAGDGTFHLTTRHANDGAAPGQYKVYVEPKLDKTRAARLRLPFPPKYIDEDASGIVIEVQARANQLDTIKLR